MGFLSGRYFGNVDIPACGHYVTGTFRLEDIPVAKYQWVWRGRGAKKYYHRSPKGRVKPLDAAILYYSQVHHIPYSRKQKHVLLFRKSDFLFFKVSNSNSLNFFIGKNFFVCH